MLPITKPKKFVTTVTKTSKVNNEAINEKRFISQYPNNSAAPQTTTTISSINLKDEYQDQSDSTINRTWYNIYDSNWHFTEETIKMEHINEFSNEDIDESVNNTCNDCIRETETKAEIKVEINNEEKNKVDVSDRKLPIKSEPVDTDEEREKTVNSHFSILEEKKQIKSESFGVLESEENQIDNSSELCEVIKQRRKLQNNSPTPLRNQRRNTPLSKEPVVPLEQVILSKYNTQDSCKQLTASASSTKDDENENHSSIKGRIGFEEVYILETLTNGADTTTVVKYENTTTDNSCVMYVYNCTYCSYKSYHEGYLKKHIKSQHTNIQFFNCSYCSYKAHHKCNLDQHINSKHTKTTVFNCSYCSYKTCKKCTLDQHINSQHTKSTVFNCSYCSYTTYRKGHLNLHINSRHTKNTVFNCSYCSYKTCQKSNLNKHINRQHTKSTYFSCSHCSYKTFYKRVLRKHVTAKHS